MAIAAAGDAEVWPVRSSDEKRVLGLCYRRAGGEQILWLANLTPEPQKLRIGGGDAMSARILDAASFTATARDPAAFASGASHKVDGGSLSLAPYAVAMLRATTSA
jgi:hypothetical protein